MEIKKETKDTVLAFLMGTNQEQALERHAYYARKVLDGDLDFKENQLVDNFFDYLSDNFEDPINDEDTLKKIANENGFVYLNEIGLESINLLKEYNPTRYVQLGRREELIEWGWEMNTYYKDRYKEIKQIVNYDSIEENYRHELISLIKDNHYFEEAPSESYFNSTQPFYFDTPRNALFHEYMLERLFTNEEIEELISNYENNLELTDKMTKPVKQWLQLNKSNREWIQKNRNNIVLFNDSILNFIETLGTLEEIAD